MWGGFTKLNLRSFRHAVSLAVLITITLWAILYWAGFFKENRDILMFFGFAATATSILVIVIQNMKVHDWNRRIAGQSALQAFREKTKPPLEILDKEFNYILRDEKNALSIKDIHDKICKKDGEGRYLTCAISGKFELSPDGSKLYNAIREYLNLHEDIASGVHQGVYDREIVANLMATNFIKISTLFGPYIEHFNADMYPASQGRIWVNIKTLGADFKNEYRKDNKAEKRDKTG